MSEEEIAKIQEAAALKERAAIFSLLQAHEIDCKARGLSLASFIISGIASEVEDGMQHDAAHVARLLTH